MKIFDTSSIICLLKEIEEPCVLDICETLGHDIYITAEVHNELQKNPQTYKKFQEYGKIGVIPYDNTKYINHYKKRYIWMHDGEASVISIGHYLKEQGVSFYCIIDEKARRISRENGLSTTGTIGLLLWEYEKNKLSKEDLKRIKNKLQRSPFRIGKELLDLLDK